jgi:hypothetical protein
MKRLNKAAIGIAEDIVVKSLAFRRKPILNIEGIRKTKNAVAQAFVMLPAHRSSLRYSPVRVRGLAAAKKKKNINKK